MRSHQCRKEAPVRDIHCHILPGVDDGARDLDESLAMLEAAKQAGVTSIVCTPHCRDPYFDFDAMWDAFNQLAPRSPIPMRMGFEVNIRKLRELGMDWAPYLCFQDSKTLLLELSTHATKRDFEEYEREIYELQGMGLDVIIAHPERYKAIQEDTSIAERLVSCGCVLQASSDFIRGGRMGKERKPAQRLFEAGLYTYIASDAHCVEHYEAFSEAVYKFGHMLRTE